VTIFIKAACESLLGSNTSLNSNNGAVESGWTIDAETMKKCTRAKKRTISFIIVVDVVLGNRHQGGCDRHMGKKVDIVSDRHVPFNKKAAKYLYTHPISPLSFL
jgi:hypothetical protein